MGRRDHYTEGEGLFAIVTNSDDMEYLLLTLFLVLKFGFTLQRTKSSITSLKYLRLIQENVYLCEFSIAIVKH